MAKELISSEIIDEIVQKFFEEKGYSSRKILSGGFLFLKEKEKIFVTITNLSGRFSSSISVSIEN